MFYSLSLPLQTLGDTIKAGWRGWGMGGQSIRSSIHGSAQAQLVIQMNKFSIWEAETLCCESHTYENMWSGGERAHGVLISSSHVHHMNSCRHNKASMLLKRVFVLSCGLPNCAKLCVVQLWLPREHYAHFASSLRRIFKISVSQPRVINREREINRQFFESQNCSHFSPQA